MQKGENLIMGDLTFDPAGLSFIEFGKDGEGKPASRQHFKETAQTKEWHNIPSQDVDTFKEFARINELYRETDEVI